MKRNPLSLLFAIVALALAVCFWRWFHAGLSQMEIADRLNHEFTVGAYAVTWLIQLGYLALLSRKWLSMKRRQDR